jgi:UDP-N-acetylmuramate--alanine ligase
LDHPVVQSCLPRLRRRVITYGYSAQAEYRADRVRQAGRNIQFRVWRGELELGDLTLNQPGRHNVLNALAAVAVATELGIEFAQVAAGLDGFSGVDRRFSERGEIGGVLIVDDYAHHPVEIRATLAAAAEGYEGRRIITLFQPHRFSRVASLKDEFCQAFHPAGVVIVLPVYAAGEAAIEGASQEALVEGLIAHGHRNVLAAGSIDAAVELVAAMVRSGDIVLTLGAGDVTRACGLLADRLRAAGAS